MSGEEREGGRVGRGEGLKTPETVAFKVSRHYFQSQQSLAKRRRKNEERERVKVCMGGTRGRCRLGHKRGHGLLALGLLALATALRGSPPRALVTA